MTPIAFAGGLTEKDFGRVNWLASRKMLWVLISLVVGLAIFLLWQWGWRRILAYPGAALTTFAPLVLVLPVMLALRPLMVRRYWRSNKLSQRPIKGVVTDEGITWEIEGFSLTRFPWDLLLAYRETASLILIYQGLNQVLYFFPHYFADDQQWQAFRALVRSRLRRK